MDPDANLTEQLSLAADVLETVWPDGLSPEAEEMFDKAGRLAELVSSLNDWITSGGFLPKPWNKS